MSPLKKQTNFAKPLWLFLLSVLILSSLINAVELNNTFINATNINLTINVTTPSIFFDSMQVENNSIYFTGLRSSDSSGNKLTFNITKGNNSYTGSDLPYFSSATNNKYIITTNLQGSVPTYITISSSADPATVTKVILGTNTYEGSNAKDVFNRLLSGTQSYTLTSGSTTIELTYGGSSMQSNVLKIVVGFIALLVLFIAIGGFFTYLIKSKGLTALGSLDPTQILTYGIVLLVCIVLAGALIDYIYKLI